VRARLAVEVSGEGPPLVLLHGLATDRHIWDQVVPDLARSRQVAAVDLPGFGESESTGDGYDLDVVANRIARGLAAHGVRGPFDLVGHSLGGGVALTLAAARPRTVRRLVLVAPAGFRPMPAIVTTVLASTADALLTLRRNAAGLTELPWGRRLLLAMAAADGAGVPPTLARQMVTASVSARRTAPALATITAADLRPLLREAPAGLGVIWGQSDLTVPIRALETIREARPDTSVIVLRNAGHVPMVERPGAFVEALSDLLQTLPTLLKDATSSAPGPTTLL
jgi:pimeloyl-ACP methyl ester carboxylesterase